MFAIHNMKTFPLLLVLLLAQLRLQANDGVFYASGSNLFPLKETTISLEKEVLKFRISKDLRIYVDVYFEFNNPGPEKELTVGFVTPPASGDIAEEKTEHPQISNFTVQHNNTNLPFKIWRAGDSGFKLSENVADGNDFVYFFTIRFLPGLNKIHHTYEYKAAGGVDMVFQLNYRITTGKMWANHEIGDFRMELDAGNHAFVLPWSLQQDGSKAAWQLEGSGKIGKVKNHLYDHDGCWARTLDGKVVLTAKHFRPDYDLYFFEPRFFGTFLTGLSAVFNDPKKDTLETNIYGLDSALISNMAEWELQTLRNYMYATVGYAFSNPKWKAYFEKQEWYCGFPELKKPETWFNETQTEVMRLLLAEEKRRKK